MTKKREPRRNYSLSILIALGIAFIILGFILLSAGGFATFNFLSVTEWVCALSIPVFIGRCFVSPMSYFGRVFDYLIGGAKNLLDILVDKFNNLGNSFTKLTTEDSPESTNEKPNENNSYKFENRLTPIGIVLGIALGLTLFFVGSLTFVPFGGLPSFLTGLLFVSAYVGFSAGVFARIGRAKDNWDKKEDENKNLKALNPTNPQVVGLNNETMSIILAFLVGLGCVIAGLVHGIAIFGAIVSPGIGLLCLPIIIGGTISGASYIGRAIDVYITLSLWHIFHSLWRKVTRQPESQYKLEDAKEASRGPYERKGIVLGVVIGLILSSLLVAVCLTGLAAVSIPTLGLPVPLAAALFILSTTGGVAGLIARISQTLDTYWGIEKTEKEVVSTTQENSVLSTNSNNDPDQSNPLLSDNSNSSTDSNPSDPSVENTTDTSREETSPSSPGGNVIQSTNDSINSSFSYFEKCATDKIRLSDNEATWKNIRLNNSEFGYDATSKSPFVPLFQREEGEILNQNHEHSMQTQRCSPAA